MNRARIFRGARQLQRHLERHRCQTHQPQSSRGVSYRAHIRRAYSTPVNPSQSKHLETPEDISAALSEPTWSINTLLPAPNSPLSAEITPTKLSHLLRLCALPPPENDEEEAKMLHDLHSQLHFVRSIQEVDTTGVAPLRAIRDESAAAQKEGEISLETLKEALEREVVLGKFHRRIRRDKSAVVNTGDAEEWDALALAPKKVGRYFVVEGKDS